MGLIEDARALAESDPTRDDSSSSPGTCRYCGGETVGRLLTMRVLHADTCPWLALPRIVAALEAAQQMLDYIDVPASGYNAKYGLLPGTWWYDWPDQPFVQKIREAMRDG